MNDVAIISTKTKIAVLLYLGYSYCYSSCGFKCLILQKI